MTDGEPYDYSSFENTWLYSGKPLTKEQRTELIEGINPDMCKKHGIEAVAEHQALLFDLVRIMKTGSEVPETDGKILPPKDQPTVKSARSKIAQASGQLGKAEDLLHGLTGNETARALLEHCNAYDHFESLLPALNKLISILEEASRYEGHHGQRQNPDWVRFFCETCQKFWGEFMSGGKTLVYQNEQESRISEWVHDLYWILGKVSGENPPVSMLLTYAKNPNR
ncbi:hypothetical protein ACEWPL_011295 [Roseovarius sp. S1116L3]|uniref:hypothetical protein n=1 Tax=Roseovarius roseus TaxID=3342636 RepID=UPI00372915C1